MSRSSSALASSPSILRMSAPLVLSFWMRSLFTFVDTIYAATLGDAAVAAIGLSIPLEFLMIACWVGVSTGLTSNLSRAMGAREGGRIEQLLAVSRRIIWALVPIFVVIAVGIVFGARHLGLEPKVASYFAIYGGVLVGGSAFSAFWSILPDSIVKAHHDTRSTMWAGIWSNLINVGLNTLFTFVFHWGIFGIAFSTVVGRFGGLIYALRKAASHEAERKASGLDTSPTLDPAPFRSIMRLAVPSGLTYSLMAVETSLVNWLLTRQDPAGATASIAAYGIYYRVLLFALMPIIAASVAVLPFVARRFGEGDLKAIRGGLRQLSLAGVGYCALLVTPALLLGGPALARSLAEAPVTAHLTRVALGLCPLACLVMIPFQLCRPAFEGLGRGLPGLVMAVLRYVFLTGLCASLGMIVAHRLGQPALYGLIVGLIAASGIASLVFLIWMGRALGRLEGRLKRAGAELEGQAERPRVSGEASQAPVP
ncbi:MAG TPA: MATE family efflux transporter [Candidatus Polarisedimenticolia bacterium]|nr:MATE family efflux transporter [Candidatus Polarisedimenticolia bacterium]